MGGVILVSKSDTRMLELMLVARRELVESAI